jgi:hypothetical protein
MAKQLRAVELQEQNGGYRSEFFEELSSDEVQTAKTNPRLLEAERLFCEVRSGGQDTLAPGPMAITTLQLAVLLHCQGRLTEARDLYEDVIRKCRLIAEETEEAEWALCRALLRLAELIIREDTRKGKALFAESLEIARKRKDTDAIKSNQRAIRFFMLDDK